MKHLAILILGFSMVGVASAQSDAERNYINNGFAALDANKDGTITQQEFDVFMTARIKKQRAEFDKGFAAADENGDGFIDRKEAEINAALLENFDKLDTDKNGKVTKSELTTAILAATQNGV